MENIALSKRVICESLCRSASGERYKLTALRSFMETVPLNCNFRRLVRRNFRGFTVPIDATVGRAAADESNYRSDQVVAGSSRSWTSSSSMTRILLARRRFGVTRRRLLPLIRDAHRSHFPAQRSGSVRRIRYTYPS